MPPCSCPPGPRRASSSPVISLPADIAVFPFPLDFSSCVSRAISTLQPDLFVNFETEFWPNFFRELNTGGIPALLLNGRISSSSARFYRLFSPLFGPVFEQFTYMAMHSQEDMERAVGIGAPPSKIAVLGSSKYDGLAERASRRRRIFGKNCLPSEMDRLSSGAAFAGRSQSN